MIDSGALNRYKRKLIQGVHSVNSLLNPLQVGYLILFVTNRCNFRCGFCFYFAEIEKGRKPEELTLEELSKISLKTGPLLQLSIGGGEPFLRKDLGEIVTLFVENNYVTYITIPTNASLTHKMVSFIEDVLPEFPNSYFRLCFSIDGIGEEHDKIRSYPGAYDKILQSYTAINPLKKKYCNLILDANSVFTSMNENTLLETIETLDKDFDFDNISVTYARGKIKNTDFQSVSSQRYIEINKYLETLRRKKEKRFLYPIFRGVRDVSRNLLIRSVFFDEFVLPCVAGRKLLVLSETGEVFPCEILGKSMGNIKEFNYDMKKLLNRKRNKKLVHWIKASKCMCSFECALAANVLWNYASYIKLAKSTVRNVGRS